MGEGGYFQMRITMRDLARRLRRDKDRDRMTTSALDCVIVPKIPLFGKEGEGRFYESFIP